MRTVEVSAKTREEAIKKALHELGVERDEAHVEILDEGSRGIFGLGARDVRLRVSSEAAKARPSHAAGDAALLLKEIIQRTGIEATVRSESTADGGMCLKVSSPDSALLIGRKGRSLSSLQYLINRMIHRGDNDDTERITIDIEGYLDRRQEALEDLARRLARRAKETGRRVRVKPMSAQERRIIHVVLENDPDVKTFSIGDAAMRSVVIAPKDEKTGEDERGSERHQRRPHPQRRGGGPRQGGERRGPSAQPRREHWRDRRAPADRSGGPDLAVREEGGDRPDQGERGERENRTFNGPRGRRRGRRRGGPRPERRGQGPAPVEAPAGEPQDA
ncbi:MAG: hypothetical protein AMXMBFR4_00200 [Candidatus Hydrogenedentota bacterium]